MQLTHRVLKLIFITAIALITSREACVSEENYSEWTEATSPHSEWLNRHFVQTHISERSNEATNYECLNNVRTAPKELPAWISNQPGRQWSSSHSCSPVIDIHLWLPFHSSSSFAVGTTNGRVPFGIDIKGRLIYYSLELEIQEPKSHSDPSSFWRDRNFDKWKAAHKYRGSFTFIHPDKPLRNHSRLI